MDPATQNPEQQPDINTSQTPPPQSTPDPQPTPPVPPQTRTTPNDQSEMAAEQPPPQVPDQVPPTIGVIPKKSKKGLIIVLCIIGGLLSLSIVGAYLISSNTKEDPKSSDASSSKKTAKDNNNITATSESQYYVVCDGGTVKNTAAAGTPYKITTFFTNPSRSNWYPLSVGYKKTYSPDYDKPEEINTVACLEAKSDTETKAKTCEFESNGKTTSVDYYSLQYKLTYYDAKTGKKINANESVAAPANTCPYSTLLKDGATKLYADPDKTTVEELHQSFSAGS